MKILVLTHILPFPPNDGSRIRLWNMCRCLARQNDALLLSSGQGDMDSLSGVGTFAMQVYPATPERTFASPIERWIRGMVTGIPPSVLAGNSLGLRGQVRALSIAGWPDVVLAEGNSAAHLLTFVPDGTPTVHVKHSVQVRDVQELTDPATLFGPRRKLEIVMARRYERRSLIEASSTVVVAEEDGEELKQRYGFRHAVPVPNGVDGNVFRLRRDPNSMVIAFLGNFEWAPNVQAMQWFCNEMLPSVRREISTVELSVVGKGIDERLRRSLTRKGVRIVGYAEDIAEALSDASVGIVPVRHGTGIRCELLEFFSLGLATVTTTLGSRGTGAKDGVHCLMRDEPESFAQGVTELLQSQGRRDFLRKRASDLVGA